jgi:hypothetical protein
MKTITEIALERARNGVFTLEEVNCWVAGSADRQYSLLKRAMNAGEVLRIRSGLYCLAPRYLSAKPNPLVLAERIYGPSYISLETALSYHGWIPEAAYAVTSASLPRSTEFDTPVGLFTYTRVPQHTFLADVQRVETGRSSESFLLASPLKAVADYVYVHKCNWTTARPLFESLRIEEDCLAETSPESMNRLRANYRSKRVRTFLEGLQEELVSCPSK